MVGKDLRSTELLIATGGVFRFVDDPVATVREGLADIDNAQAPREPRIAVDSRYSLYAIGLLARFEPALARALADTTLDREASQ